MSKLAVSMMICLSSIVYAYTFPDLKIPKNWIKKKDPLPSIAASFDRIQGQKKIDIIFTDYAIPKIQSKDQFKSYVQSLYPVQSDHYPRIDIRELKDCKTKFTSCYTSILRVTHKTSEKFIVLLHLSYGNSYYLGMADMSGHEDNFINAQKVSKEMQSAVSP